MRGTRSAAAAIATAITSLASLPAFAQSKVTGSVGGSVEYTTNAPLEPEGPLKSDDTVYELTPSIDARSQTQGLEALLRYTLDYWHYQKNSSLDRALHDLDARADLTWWEDFDLELSEDLVPVPRDFGAPLDNPANDAQSSHAGGKLDFKHDFNDHTHGTLGYQAEYVDWIAVHNGDPALPGFVIQGPRVGITRDFDHVLSATLEYGYRAQHFIGPNYPPVGDLAYHYVSLTPIYTPSDSVRIRVSIGPQAVSFASGSSVTRTMIDGSLEIAGKPGDLLTATYLQHLTTDVSGNAADEKVGELKAAYAPFDHWGFGVGGAWGDLHLVPGPTNPYGDRSFLEARASLFYLLPTRARDSVTLAYSHHQTLSSSGGLPDLNVDYVSLGARVGFE